MRSTRDREFTPTTALYPTNRSYPFDVSLADTTKTEVFDRDKLSDRDRFNILTNPLPVNSSSGFSHTDSSVSFESPAQPSDFLGIPAKNFEQTGTSVYEFFADMPEFDLPPGTTASNFAWNFDITGTRDGQSVSGDFSIHIPDLATDTTSRSHDPSIAWTEPSGESNVYSALLDDGGSNESTIRYLQSDFSEFNLIDPSSPNWTVSQDTDPDATWTAGTIMRYIVTMSDATEVRYVRSSSSLVDDLNKLIVDDTVGEAANQAPVAVWVGNIRYAITHRDQDDNFYGTAPAVAVETLLDASLTQPTNVEYTDGSFAETRIQGDNTSTLTIGSGNDEVDLTYYHGDYASLADPETAWSNNGDNVYGITTGALDNLNFYTNAYEVVTYSGTEPAVQWGGGGSETRQIDLGSPKVTITYYTDTYVVVTGTPPSLAWTIDTTNNLGINLASDRGLRTTNIRYAKATSSATAQRNRFWINNNQVESGKTPRRLYWSNRVYTLTLSGGFWITQVVADAEALLKPTDGSPAGDFPTNLEYTDGTFHRTGQGGDTNLRNNIEIDRSIATNPGLGANTPTALWIAGVRYPRSGTRSRGGIRYVYWENVDSAIPTAIDAGTVETNIEFDNDSYLVGDRARNADTSLRNRVNFQSSEVPAGKTPDVFRIDGVEYDIDIDTGGVSPDATWDNVGSGGLLAQYRLDLVGGLSDPDHIRVEVAQDTHTNANVRRRFFITAGDVPTGKTPAAVLFNNVRYPLTRSGTIWLSAVSNTVYTALQGGLTHPSNVEYSDGTFAVDLVFIDTDPDGTWSDVNAPRYSITLGDGIQLVYRFAASANSGLRSRVRIQDNDVPSGKNPVAVLLNNERYVLTSDGGTDPDFAWVQSQAGTNRELFVTNLPENRDTPDHIRIAYYPSTHLSSFLRQRIVIDSTLVPAGKTPAAVLLNAVRYPLTISSDGSAYLSATTDVPNTLLTANLTQATNVEYTDGTFAVAKTGASYETAVLTNIETLLTASLTQPTNVEYVDGTYAETRTIGSGTYATTALASAARTEITRSGSTPRINVVFTDGTLWVPQTASGTDLESHLVILTADLPSGKVPHQVRIDGSAYTVAANSAGNGYEFDFSDAQYSSLRGVLEGDGILTTNIEYTDGTYALALVPGVRASTNGRNKFRVVVGEFPSSKTPVAVWLGHHRYALSRNNTYQFRYETNPEVAIDTVLAERVNEGAAGAIETNLEFSDGSFAVGRTTSSSVTVNFGNGISKNIIFSFDADGSDDSTGELTLTMLREFEDETYTITEGPFRLAGVTAFGYNTANRSARGPVIPSGAVATADNPIIMGMLINRQTYDGTNWNDVLDGDTELITYRVTDTTQDGNVVERIFDSGESNGATLNLRVQAFYTASRGQIEVIAPDLDGATQVGSSRIRVRWGLTEYTDADSTQVIRAETGPAFDRDTETFDIKRNLTDATTTGLLVGMVRVPFRFQEGTNAPEIVYFNVLDAGQNQTELTVVGDDSNREYSFAYNSNGTITVGANITVAGQTLTANVSDSTATSFAASSVGSGVVGTVRGTRDHTTISIPFINSNDPRTSVAVEGTAGSTSDGYYKLSRGDQHTLVLVITVPQKLFLAKKMQGYNLFTSFEATRDKSAVLAPTKAVFRYGSKSVDAFVRPVGGNRFVVSIPMDSRMDVLPNRGKFEITFPAPATGDSDLFLRKVRLDSDIDVDNNYLDGTSYGSDSDRPDTFWFGDANDSASGLSRGAKNSTALKFQYRGSAADVGKLNVIINKQKPIVLLADDSIREFDTGSLKVTHINTIELQREGSSGDIDVTGVVFGQVEA